MSLTDAAGMSWNWSGGTKTPMMLELNGILNVFLGLGTGCSSTFPSITEIWGIVADIIG